MTDIEFISSQGLAGFMELGFVEQGFKLMHRTGTLDFGNQMVEKNRHLMGDAWDSNFNDDSDSWYVPKTPTQLVVGLPPCSGWSCWTGPANRGPEAKAHEHTKAFMRYVGRVQPSMAVFECVGQAYTQGREVMLKYRDMVEEISGRRYDLHHVKMNNLQNGGFSYRPRYFWVAVRKGMYFAPRTEWPARVPSIMEIIGDLADLPQQWEAQPYQAPHEHWVCSSLSKTGMVDGHQGHTNIHMRRIAEIFEWLERGGETWNWGEGLSFALKRVYEMHGELPPTWEGKSAKIIEKQFDMGFSLPYRWAGDAWANVLTGGCLDMVVHPTRPRCITHREAARIQGLPDDWLIEPSKNYGPLGDTWGKAVSKHAGVWIAGHVRASLEGRVSEADQNATGVMIGDREWLHETDTGFSRQRARTRYFPGTRGGISRAYNPELWPFGNKQVKPVLLEEELPDLEPAIA